MSKTYDKMLIKMIDKGDPEAYKQMLMDLLAIIHRDGGHYTEDHGLIKSVKDAKTIITNLLLNYKITYIVKE